MVARQAAVCVLLSLGWACSGKCSRVNETPPVSQLTSYAWSEGSAPVDPPLEGRIRRSIDAFLRSREYVADPAGTPDFVVSCETRSVGVRPDQLIVTLDFREPGSRSVRWRCTAQAYCDPQAPPENREKRIDALVTAMLEEFPPR